MNTLFEQMIRVSRRYIASHSPLRRVYRAAKRQWQLRKYAGPAFIRGFAKVYPRAFFIQIGSNDGMQQDPLHDAILAQTWSGIMVEPVPYVYERLVANYGHLSRLLLENVAIADCEGLQPFFHLQKSEGDASLPPWYDALGSFSREVVLKHVNYIPDIEQRIVCTQVPCVTFETLCQRHAVEMIDLLHIDTEGYDYEIIKRVDFERHRPRLLIYEHHHLSAQDRQSCGRHLEDLGYDLLEEGLDTWCVDQGERMDPDLRLRWRQLKKKVLRLRDAQ